MPWGVVASVAGAVVSSAMAPSGGGQQQGGQQGPPPGGSGSGNLGNALGNLYLTSQGAQNIQQAGTTAAGMADPFSQSRQLANTQLQQLMQHPGDMSNDPASQWAMSQGIQATNRGIAAQHQTNSGNAQTELMNYGQGLANQQYNNRLGQLGAMASQGASPTAAAQDYLGATETAQSGLSAAGMGAMAAADPLIQSAGSWLGKSVGSILNYSGPSGSLPQYSTGSWYNPTGYNTGVGGSGYSSSSMGSEQASMLNSQWS